MTQKTTEKKTEGETKTDRQNSEVIEGIRFVAEKGGEDDTIADCLGMDTDRFVAIMEAMWRFFRRSREDRDTDSKVEAFKDFLQSEKFQHFNFHPTKPEEYVLLGLGWAFILKNLDEGHAGHEHEAILKKGVIKMNSAKAKMLMGLLEALAE